MKTNLMLTLSIALAAVLPSANADPLSLVDFAGRNVAGGNMDSDATNNGGESLSLGTMTVFAAHWAQMIFAFCPTDCYWNSGSTLRQGSHPLFSEYASRSQVLDCWSAWSILARSVPEVVAMDFGPTGFSLYASYELMHLQYCWASGYLSDGSALWEVPFYPDETVTPMEPWP